MRYLVFGDVHGNLLALDAVLAAGRARGVEGYLFVGDLIGYGPDPLACIERVSGLQTAGKLAWVAGNHELAMRSDFDLTRYNDEARRTLEWARRLLAEQPIAQKFVADAELSLQINGTIFLTHDSLAEPSSGHYHRYPQNAKSELACLRYRGGRVCFYGHTHSMRAELLRADGEIILAPIEAHDGAGRDEHPLRLGLGELGWVGTGSAGLPTNAQRWPEFLILDDADWHVEKYVVSYDRVAAKARTREVLAPVCGDEVAEHVARWL